MLKLNSKGISHLLIPLIVVVVGVAAFGTYKLVSSSAASAIKNKGTITNKRSGPGYATRYCASVADNGKRYVERAQINGQNAKVSPGTVGKKAKPVCVTLYQKNPSREKNMKVKAWFRDDSKIGKPGEYIVVQKAVRFVD